MDQNEFELTNNVRVCKTVLILDIAAGLPVRGDRGGDAGERDRVSLSAPLLRSGGHEIPLHRRDLQQSGEGRFLGVHRRGLLSARQEE